MGTFGTLGFDAITPQPGLGPMRAAAGLGSLRGAGGPRAAGGLPGLSFLTDRGDQVAADEIADQFVLFQFSDAPEGPRILESSQIEPRWQGSPERPDALASLQLASFHIGRDERIESDARATLRLDFGKDEASASSLGTLFWSIAAGLNLYDEATKKAPPPKDLKADFNEAFTRRPIEVPGGLARLRFEVVRHKPPPWWRKVFGFLQSGAGEMLTAAIGFPAITTRAIGVIDELFGRLDESSPEVLFKSRPLTLALSKQAKRDFTGGIADIHVGALNPGFCLLARGRDYDKLLEHDPVYLAHFGVLKPKPVSMEQFLRAGYADPLADVTYAVIKVGTVEAQIQTAMQWGR